MENSENWVPPIFVTCGVGTASKEAVAAAAAAAKPVASSWASGVAGGRRLANRRVELGQLANLTVIGSLLPGIR